MTATPEQSNPQPVYIWFAQPEIGREQILMVLVDDKEYGVTYRPLMFLDLDAAESQRDLAQQAASALGVKAALREYEAVSLLDTAEPGA